VLPYRMLDARPVAQSALLRLSVFLVCLGYGALSHAHMGPNVKLPGSYFFVGPSVAWVGGDVEGVALNLDAAYSVSFFALSLNLKYLHGSRPMVVRCGCLVPSSSLAPGSS
jgi:hypothetical protein